MTLLWNFYVLTPCFTPLACVMLRTYEYTTLIYMANVFCPHCTMIYVSSGHYSQRFSLCLVTQVHTGMPLLEAVYYAEANVALPAEIQRTPCFLLLWTHAAPTLFSFGRPMLRMLYFQSTELGRSWTWSAPWNATSCHILLLRMEDQFTNENFTEMFVRHFATTRLEYKKCVKNGHVCKVKKQFSDPLPSSADNSIAVDHSVWLVTRPHVCIVVFCMRFDSLARFVGEISFNRGSMHVCHNVHILPVFPANSP